MCRKNIMSTIHGMGYANTTWGIPLVERLIYIQIKQTKRQQAIHLIVLLSNLQARLVGISQICITYKAHLNKDLK